MLIKTFRRGENTAMTGFVLAKRTPEMAKNLNDLKYKSLDQTILLYILDI